MRNFTIQSGSFSAGKGHFTAYSAKGEKVFVHKRIMDSLGFNKTVSPTFPLYAIVNKEEITPWGDDGKPIMEADGVTVHKEWREQALSIFKTKEAMIEAYVDDATLDIEIKQAISVKATASGLSADSLATLMAVTF